MIFNMAGGGGGNDTIYAALVVYIDAGSTITVTDGVSTFTGTSVNGECLFDKLTPATWAVTATSGTDTTTGSVVITNSSLIDGYPDPLISTLELHYRPENVVVGYLWGSTTPKSTTAKAPDIYLYGCDSEYLSYDAVTTSTFVAQTGFTANVRRVGNGYKYGNTNYPSRVHILKNGVDQGFVEFSVLPSEAENSLSVSLSAGDTLRMTCNSTANSDAGYITSGMCVEVTQ